MANKELQGFPQYLVQKEMLTAEKAESCFQESIKMRTPFIPYLLEKNEVSSLYLSKLISEYFGMPVFDLSSMIRNKELEGKHQGILNHKEYAVVPLSETAGNLYVGVVDPTISYINQIAFELDCNVIPVIIAHSDYLAFHAKFSEDAMEAFDAPDMDGLEDIGIMSEEDIDEGEEESGQESAPIVRYVHKYILDAIKSGSSDIHFEPYEDYFRVRYRQDGVLREVSRIPVTLVNKIIARLKIISLLDISEKRIPQDGRFKLKLDAKHAIDFRISTCPVINGEKVVIRILDPTSITVGVDKLGFNEKQKALLTESIQKPQGMVLVTGPTGSGKTVTLYTAINMLDRDAKNISTIEDPVEIKLQGINQVNVNVKTGLDFVSVLRSFLRQDPDVILVGEMRDTETTNIAIRAAQTGHMVFSTLHTNSASETITRLMEMGVASFNLASSLTLVVAQRLVRTLCQGCKEPANIPEAQLLEVGFTEEDIKTGEFFKAVGCEKCNGGYKGRVGVYEVLPITSKIREALSKSVTAVEINKIAIAEGMETMRVSGLKKVKTGVTTLEELNRVIVDED